MKCSECDGVGYKKISATSCAICERCGGMGEVKQTNFQCITKSPETLAHWICEYVDFCDGGCSKYPIQEKCLYDSDGAGNRDNEDMLVEWLREVHDDK